MRLFTGIPGATDSLIDLLSQLGPRAKLQWSPAANLHITTKFIGEWPEARLPEIIEALRMLPQPGPLRIEIVKLGFFPNAKSPRVLWAGVDAPGGLHDLARDTETALAAMGVKPEDRPFTPHVTLARIASPSAVAPILESITNCAQNSFGMIEAHSFHLYRSIPTPRGSRYQPLETFPLQ